MEKRVLLAIALSFGLLLVWNTLLFPPPRPAGKPAPASAAPSLAPMAGPAAPAPERPEAPAGSPPGPAPDRAAGGEEVVEAQVKEERVVETDLYRIRLSNQGAVVLSWQLKRYRDDQGRPLELVSPGAPKVKRFPLGLEFRDEKLTERVGRALFRTEVESGENGAGNRISFRYSDGGGLDIVKVLEVAKTAYVARLELGALRNGEPLEGMLLWGAGFGLESGLVSGGANPNEAARAILLRDGKIIRHLRDAVAGKRELQETGSIAWAGLEDSYFAGLILPHGGSPGATVKLYPVIEEGREKAFLSLGLNLAPSRQYTLFVGPKDYDLLAGLKIGIEGVVDFGFFGSIAQALFFLLKHINRATGNWGWSIIILTLFIRLAFFPLTHKSSVSMRRTQEKMKKIQPRMQAIRDRYRKMKKDMANRQKMNDEIMALYKKEGVNPLSGMSGCLPLLLQLPILWGFYNLLNVAIELRHAPFALWITDLSKKDPYYVTPIVMGITMLIQQAMTGSTIPDPVQRRMMMLMPVVFTWFFKDLPSGLVLYWLVNNVLAIGQQYLINAQAARENAREGALAKG